jgi:predicted DNA-binding protein (MmcQ/YjbR family)
MPAAKGTKGTKKAIKRATKPAATKPAATKPVATKPVATKPVATKPAAKKLPAGAGAKAEAALRAFALSLPGAVEEFPWNDRAMKVNKKVFVFLGTHEGGLAMSTKLPQTAAIALTLPFASPTRYGLGKSGWVTALFAAGEAPPLDMLRAWIEESYCAIAPVKLVKTLPARVA